MATQNQKPHCIHVFEEGRLIPAELRELDQWVVWRHEMRDDKWTKVPYNPRTLTRADSTDPTTWATFAEALDVFNRDASIDGIGFVFSEDDPYSGVDFDKCIFDGELDPDKRAWVESLLSWTEYSPSETGLHTIVRGVVPGDRRKSVKHGVEMYDSGRFFTFTGLPWGDKPLPIRSRQKQLKALYNELFPTAKPSGDNAATSKPNDDIPADDEELLRIMFASRNGAEIKRLFDGDISGHNHDDSSADLALCNHLAFWTDRDGERMDRLFRQSELYRDKWERQDYREATINKAIAATSEGYAGPRKKQKAQNAQSTEAVKQDNRPKSERLMEAIDGLGLNLRLNLLEDEVEINGRRMDDITLSEINLRLVDQGFSRADIADAVNVVAGQNRYHPVKDYLNGLEWDGEDHLGVMLKHLRCNGPELDYGSNKIKLPRVLIAKWLVGCAARGLDGDNPESFKFQTPMLVLIGPQGIGKSSFVRYLASGIGLNYHRESMVNPRSIEDQRTMVTKWIWEVTELAGSLRRVDRDAIKSFITQEWHTYRKPYGKNLITKPTLCNLVGTLNPETGFLEDPTGYRRFWPVTITEIDHEYAQSVDINQVWAQVVHLYRTRQLLPQLTPAELEALKSLHEEHEIENPLEAYIRMYFTIEPGNDMLRCHTATIIDRLKAFNVALPNDLRYAGRAINDVLAPMGLTRGKFSLNGAYTTGWMGIAPNRKLAPGAEREF